jgi:hypothetical protein
VVLEQADSYCSINDWAANNGGRSCIFVNQVNNTSAYVTVIGLRCEPVATSPSYNICFSTAGSAMNPVGWKISMMRSISAVRAIAALDANTNWNAFLIDQIIETTPQGISLPGSLTENSILSSGPMLLTIGTLVAGSIIIGGPKTQWTITAQDSFTLDTTAPVASGFGTPTGQTVVANFPGASATLAQTSSTLAEVLTILKAFGFITT